ncbi:MAG TPA: ABC transporter substrate-binding protein [Gaiellaceae bacterium]|nr:ABC transporter substrate-binding protein [Gaiellaceae bacterium]
MSKKTITFGVFTQLKDCGNSKVNADTAAGTKERYNTLVKWMNKNIKFPGGRTLRVKYYDSGAADPLCADVLRAALQKAIDQDHVFAIFNDIYNPAVNAADIAAKKKTIYIGFSFQTFKDLKSHAPYVWSTYEPGELSFQELSWFIRRRFAKKPYKADNGSKHARVWGALFSDTPQGHTLSNLMKKYMAQGKLPMKQYYISSDVATASQQASGIALQMQHDGVNSLVYGADALTPDITFNTAAANAGYHPDFFISQYGTLPQLAVFVPYFGAEFTKRLYGTGPPAITQERVEVDSTGSITPKSCPACYGQNNNFNVASTKAYMEAGGSAGNHPSIGSWGWGTFIWPTLTTLVMGAANAGPVLNAHTFEWGLQHGPKMTCMQQKFFGKQPYAQAPKNMYNKPPRYFLQSGFTTLYFNPNKTNFYGSKGLFESYDNFQLFNSMKAMHQSPRYDTGAAGGYKLVKQKGNFTVNTKC